MIGTFLAVIDRTIDLLGRRSENNRRLFQDQVEPVFNDVLSIHQNYQSMFSEALLLVDDDAAFFDVVTDRLQQRRRDLLPVREKVGALTLAIRRESGLPATAVEFFGRVAWYFNAVAGSDTFDRETQRYSPAASLLEAIEESTSREGTRRSIEEAQHHLAFNWMRLLEAYAAARITLLK